MRKTALIAFVLSLVLTVACAIAQASYDVYDSAAVPFATPATDFPDWPESPADESLIAYTQALANCAYLQADVSDASWEVVSSAGGYSVFAAVEDGERYTFVYLPDGRLAAYQTAGTLPPVSQRLLPQEGFLTTDAAAWPVSAGMRPCAPRVPAQLQRKRRRAGCPLYRSGRKGCP